MENKAHILCTATLDTTLVDKASAQGIIIDVVPFISTELLRDTATLKKIDTAAKLSINVAFTSANAVTAVFDQIGATKLKWQIYCIGHSTKAAIEKYVDTSMIAGVADNAAALADEIIRTATAMEMIFFCGNSRRDVLIEKLQAEDIRVAEIVVYNTIETQNTINTKYDGILFFSPSGVNSFFNANSIDTTNTLFAIGNTTSDALKERTGNNIIVSNTPSKDSMIDDVIHHYTKQTITK